MLGIGCPDRHPLPFNLSTPLPKTHRPRRRRPARAGSFSGGFRPFAATAANGEVAPKPAVRLINSVLDYGNIPVAKPLSPFTLPPLLLKALAESFDSGL